MQTWRLAVPSFKKLVFWGRQSSWSQLYDHITVPLLNYQQCTLRIGRSSLLSLEDPPGKVSYRTHHTNWALRTNRHYMHMKEAVSEIQLVFPPALLPFKHPSPLPRRTAIALGAVLPQCCFFASLQSSSHQQDHHFSKARPEHHCALSPRWLLYANLMKSSKPPGLAIEALSDLSSLTNWVGRKKAPTMREVRKG